MIKQSRECALCFPELGLGVCKLSIHPVLLSVEICLFVMYSFVGVLGLLNLCSKVDASISFTLDRGPQVGDLTFDAFDVAFKLSNLLIGLHKDSLAAAEIA